MGARPAIPELADQRASRSPSPAVRGRIAPGNNPRRQIGKGRVAAGFWETIAKSRQNDALQSMEVLGRGGPSPRCCFASADSHPPTMYANVAQHPDHPDPRGARQTGDLSCERAKSPHEGLRCSGGAVKRNGECVARNPRRSSQPLPLDVSLSQIGLMSYGSWDSGTVGRCAALWWRGGEVAH